MEMQLAIQQTMIELLTLVPQALRVQNSPVTNGITHTIRRVLMQKNADLILRK